MIVVHGATRRLKSSDIIEHAIGMEDEHGNPLRFATLIWNQKKPNTHYAKTRGFEDVIISKTPTGVKIEYRQPGSAVWEKHDFFNTYTARVPYTPHNLSRLVSCHGDGLWSIKEPDIRKEVESGYRSAVESMSDEQRKNHDRWRLGHFKSKFDTLEEVPDPIESKRSMDEVVNMQVRNSDVVKKERELEKRQEELNRKQQYLEKQIQRLAKMGFKTVQYGPDFLEKLKMPDIRRLAAQEFGITVRASMTKSELVKSITEAQTGEGSLDMLVDDETNPLLADDVKNMDTPEEGKTDGEATVTG